MHLPAPSPALRGFRLWLVARLASVRWIRDFILTKIRKDLGIAQMPDLK